MQSFEDYTSLANSMDFRTKCWIDGQFVSAKSGETFENINPATGKKLCDVARWLDMRLEVWPGSASHSQHIVGFVGQ